MGQGSKPAQTTLIGPHPAGFKMVTINESLEMWQHRHFTIQYQFCVENAALLSIALSPA